MWMIGAVCGFDSFVAWQEFEAHASYVAPVELTPAERAADMLNTSVPPMSIRLTFEPQAQFYSGRPPGDEAYTQIGQIPCEIVAPAGWGIHATPRFGYANWDDPDDGMILAHEILNCIRGYWHPAWGKICATPPRIIFSVPRAPR